MFQLVENLRFVNIHNDYLEYLYNVCPEVYYKPDNYDNKPFVGIFMENDETKYVIPLSSAKPKHTRRKNVDRGIYLIFETAMKKDMGSKDIWVDGGNGQVKHIMSIMDIKKMIPIIDGVFSDVNIVRDEETDSEEIKKYKDLLTKEYKFCLPIVNQIISTANNIYNKQIKTGKVEKFCCDFYVLELAAMHFDPQR